MHGGAACNVVSLSTCGSTVEPAWKACRATAEYREDTFGERLSYAEFRNVYAPTANTEWMRAGIREREKLEGGPAREVQRPQNLYEFHSERKVAGTFGAAARKSTNSVPVRRYERLGANATEVGERAPQLRPWHRRHSHPR